MYQRFQGALGRSGTDLPYRPTPNEERCNRLVPTRRARPPLLNAIFKRNRARAKYVELPLKRYSLGLRRQFGGCLIKGIPLWSFKLLRNPALNPNQGRRVVSPSGGTAVPTPLFARLSRAGPLLIIWPRAILEPPFKCRQRRLAGELLLERLGSQGANHRI